MIDNKKLLEKIGETCTAKNICSECDMQVICRKEIYENHPELIEHASLN